jgi:glucokinase
MDHRYIIISGLPATGKSRLGRALSQHLGWPLLSKDLIKEALADSLGLGDEAWSSRLSEAAMEVLHRVARASVYAILDANFKEERDRDWLASLPGPKVQIFCHAPPEVLAERLVTRAASGRHPIHRDAMAPEQMAAAVRAQARTSTPIRLDVPTLSVDTSLPTDETGILTWVRASLRGRTGV